MSDIVFILPSAMSPDTFHEGMQEVWKEDREASSWEVAYKVFREYAVPKNIEDASIIPEKVREAFKGDAALRTKYEGACAEMKKLYQEKQQAILENALLLRKQAVQYQTERKLLEAGMRSWMASLVVLRTELENNSGAVPFDDTTRAIMLGTLEGLWDLQQTTAKSVVAKIKPTSIWKHKARGSEYIVIGEAIMQIDGPEDEKPCVVYQCLATGKQFCRPAKDFFDGRFEEVKG